jgi:hypothetical protein
MMKPVLQGYGFALFAFQLRVVRGKIPVPPEAALRNANWRAAAFAGLAKGVRST